MRNLEVKVNVRDKQSVVRLLNNLGAKYVCTMKQDDYYFNLGTDKTKLRIIDGNEYQLITYRRIESKGRKDSTYEIAELSAKEKDELLRKRKIEKSVEKTRDLWLYGSTRIHLDHVERLGNFLELETVLKDISLSKGEKEFKTVVNGLHIDLASSVPASYSDLMPVLA